MKKILPLTFLLTYKITGYMEKEKNLMFQMRTCLRPRIRCQKKVMVSAAIFWYGATKSFFVNENGIKVNYCKH